MTDEVLTASNGIKVDQEFWKSIKDCELTEEELLAIGQWKNKANVEGLVMMNPPKAHMGE